MNKKVTISIISIFIALALIAGVTAVFMVSAQNKEEGKLAELFCKADLLYHPEVATNINVSQVPNFTDQQKADLKEQYKDKLNEF